MIDIDGADLLPGSLTAPGQFDWLEDATAAELDEMVFGVVGLAADGTVECYNAAEGRLSGLTPARVIGRNFFTEVAPCTNNFMVAHRFETAAELDEAVNYVFAFHLARTKVLLCLLKRPGARRRYLVVQRRD
jgi:photoactive yellow protein